MKKSIIMLKFLFYTLLGLAIFVPAVMFGTKLFAATDTKGFDSYDKLVEIVSSIREGEILSTPLYMEKKSVIVGFSKDADRFETQEHGSMSNPIRIVFDRPTDCEESKACICLCSGFKVTKHSDSNINYNSECEERLICKSLDTIDILAEKAVKYETGNPFTWRGGFLFGNDLPKTLQVGLAQNQQATRTFYVERYEGIVSVCLENPLEIPCIPDEIKEQIDVSKVVE